MLDTNILIARPSIVERRLLPAALPRRRVLSVLPDPNDGFVLELAIAGRCDWIVTHNVKDFSPASAFGVRAVTPAEFLRTIEEE